MELDDCNLYFHRQPKYGARVAETVSKAANYNKKNNGLPRCAR